MNKYAPSRKDRVLSDKAFRRRMRRLSEGAYLRDSVLSVVRNDAGQIISAKRVALDAKTPRGEVVFDASRCARCGAPLSAASIRVKALCFCASICAGIHAWQSRESSTYDAERGDTFMRSLDAFKARPR